jgi:hypothetical protein
VKNSQKPCLEDQLADKHHAHKADHEVEEAHDAGDELDEDARDVAAVAPLQDHPQRVCELPGEQGSADGAVTTSRPGPTVYGVAARPIKSTAVQSVTARVGFASGVAGVLLATPQSSRLVATRPSAHAATVRPSDPNQLNPSISVWPHVSATHRHTDTARTTAAATSSSPAAEPPRARSCTLPCCARVGPPVRRIARERPGCDGAFVRSASESSRVLKVAADARRM